MKTSQFLVAVFLQQAIRAYCLVFHQRELSEDEMDLLEIIADKHIERIRNILSRYPRKGVWFQSEKIEIERALKARFESEYMVLGSKFLYPEIDKYFAGKPA